MTTHDLLTLALMLSPGILLSVLIMASFVRRGMKTRYRFSSRVRHGQGA